MVIVELAATLCIGVLLQSSQCQGSPAQSSQGSVSPSVSGGGESGLSGFLSLSLSLRLDRSDISFFCASCARVRSPLRRDFDFHRLSLLARRLTTRRTRILTYSLLFFSLNSIHTSSITTAALVIRRQNGHCGLSTQQSLLILVDHTASSNQAFNYIVTKLNFLVSLTLLSLLVFGCVLRVLKTIQFY